MKFTCLFLAIMIAVTSCAPGAKITESWKDPQTVIQPEKINKFIVAALVKNQTVRRQVEDHMASLMPGKAVPFYVEFGTASLSENDSMLNARLKQDGFDGFVLLSLKNIDSVQRYIPGNYPSYYGNWRGYWRYNWVQFYNPGYYTLDKTYHMEVNVYSLKTDRLIWSANSSAVNPDNKKELFMEVSDAVYKQMKKEGFIKSEGN